MAITFAVLGASANPDINSQTDASSYQNTSSTPPTEGLIPLWVFAAGTGGPHTPTVSGWGITWVQIGATANFGSGRGMSLFFANAEGATPGVVTVDFGGNTQFFCVAAFGPTQTGVDLADLQAAAVQQVSDGDTANATNLTLNLAAASHPDNRVIACFFHVVNESMNARANWTKGDELTGTASNRALITQWREDAYEATASSTWATGSGHGGMAVEIKALQPIAVTAAIATQAVISRTVPAMSFVENPPLWNGAGWAVTQVSLDGASGAFKLHVFPFGLLNPWDDDAAGPVEANPSLWESGNRLVTGLAKIREVSATAPIILTLYRSPWWTMGQLHASDGTTTLLTQADDDDDIGRVMINYLPDWLILVDEAVQLAVAEGCRDFEVWNEAKGYYSVPAGTGQTWDSSMEAGTADNADMGYGYFYKATAEQIVATMTALEFQRSEYRIGIAYPVLSTKGATSADAVPSNHPLYQYRNQWGYANKAPINFTRDLLGHVQAGDIPANLVDVLLLDASTFLQSGSYPSTDPFDYTEKFTHIINYWRDVLVEFGFPRDYPIDFSEIYAFPYPDLQTDGQEVLRAAMWADCLTRCVLGRVRYPIMWSATGLAQGSNSDEGGLIASAATGTLTLVGEVAAFIKDNFGPGARVYPIDVAGGAIGGMVSGYSALLYNKTNGEVTGNIRGYEYNFTAYETKMLTLPFSHERLLKLRKLFVIQMITAGRRRSRRRVR